MFHEICRCGRKQTVGGTTELLSSREPFTKMSQPCRRAGPEQVFISVESEKLHTTFHPTCYSVRLSCNELAAVFSMFAATSLAKILKP